MTKVEATEIGRIVALVDNECPFCAAGLFLELIRAFPKREQTFRDSFKVAFTGDLDEFPE